MTAAGAWLATATATIRDGAVPGWSVMRLATADRVITSPVGYVQVPAEHVITADEAEQAAARVQQLGYSADVARCAGRSRPSVSSTVSGDVVGDQISQHDDGEAEQVATKQRTTERATGKSAGRSTARAAAGAQAAPSGVVSWVYPEQPQSVSVAALVPPVGGDGDGRRYVVPRVRITPEVAEAFYARRADENNRHLRPSNLQRFRRLLENDDFSHTHQGLAFNTRGELSDGQHRMKALLDLFESGYEYSVVADITYNMPEQSAKNFDGGATRSNVDRLRVAGVFNAQRVSPLVRALYMYESSLTSNKRWKDVPPMVQSQLVDWAERFGPDLLECYAVSKQLLHNPDVKENMNMNAAAVARYIALEQWDEAPIDTFLEALGEPTLRAKGSPQRSLYNWLLRAKRDRKTRTVESVLGHFLYSYNAYCEGKQMSYVRWEPSYGMPVPWAPSKPQREDRARKRAAEQKSK